MPDIAFEIDLSDAAKANMQDTRETMDQVVANLPAIEPSAEVSPKVQEKSGALGVEWIPVLQVLVSAPAVLLAIREIGKIVRERINRSTKIKLSRTLADESVIEIEIDSQRLDAEDTQATLETFFQAE